MARRRYYRYPRRTVVAKKKWASNIVQGSLGGAAGIDSYALVINSTQTSVPTPIIVKAGNFKIQGDVYLESNSETNVPAVVNMFLVYAPQGITGSSSDLNGTLVSHPEWIMGWTAVDCDSINTTSSWHGSNKFSISTRLKRNLNSGDTIFLFCQHTSTLTLKCDFTATYYTCAN